MKRTIIFCLIIWALSLLHAISIYEIQYTNNPGNGTYPSDYAGQYVNTSGICTGINFNNNGYFLSMPEGGAWKGIFIYDSQHQPQVGDEISLYGQVWEYNGWTEMKNISNYSILSQNNPLPQTTIITSNQVNQEAYENVLCQLNQAICTETLDQYDEWQVSDGSGNALISGGFFDQALLSNHIQDGQLFTSIKGIVSYSYSTYKLNPLSINHVVPALQSNTVFIPNIEGQINQNLNIELMVSALELSQGFNHYSLDFYYPSSLITYQSYQQENTLSVNGTMTVNNSSPGLLHLEFFKNGFITGDGALINLQFIATSSGSGLLNASNVYFNETAFNVISGDCHIIGNGIEQADTITVIQRPLPNIPSICIPGEEISIECTAPQNTQNWSAFIGRRNNYIPMSLNSAVYANNPHRWIIKAIVPNVPVYEQYDLKIIASNNIEDVSKKSLKIIPSRKTNFYFAHVTDVHMPTHIFWPDTGYDTDSTETVDFREVIKDINIIRPEFVLLTGDLLNQGENEDLDNLQWYSKGQRLLLEFEVPVYLVAGNHDIGGWDSQPPSDGTARRDWWKFFGWSWLNNPDSNYPYHTQDYSFDYGNIHFTGLEAYDNYDNWWNLIYGTQSFTEHQMNWLQNDLNNSQADLKVLFYHYDFSDQLDLNQLGVDMALWGHIHSESGSLSEQPYNIATAATCDGRRAFRLIQVNNGVLIPHPMLSAGATGSKLQITYFPSNQAITDSVNATLSNQHGLDFDNALIKFNMPAGNAQYSVMNGIIEQIERTPEMNICYVRGNVSSFETITVKLWENGLSTIPDVTETPEIYIRALYPNPFSTTCFLRIEGKSSEKVNIQIFNIKGEKIRNEQVQLDPQGKVHFQWDGRDSNQRDTSNGIYFMKVSSPYSSKTSKILKLK